MIKYNILLIQNFK